MISTPDRRRWFSHSVAIPSWVVAASILMVAASSLTASVTLTRAADSASGVTTCRSQLATAVTAYTTSYLFAVGQLQAANGQVLTGLAAGGDLTEPLAEVAAGVKAITAAAVPLVQSVNLRLQFEANPHAPCPVLPPTVPSLSPPPSIPAESPTSIAGPVTPPTTAVRRRGSTTTTTGTTTTTAPTTTTTFASSPTTVPRGRLCDLVPITVPMVSVPCL